MDNNSINQVRRLTQGLFVSGALNIVLLAVFFYWIAKEVTPSHYCELKPADQTEEQIPLANNFGNAEVIRNFRSLSMEQLVAKLNDTQLVENGFSQRDLALAALVAFHHFDLSRALLGQAQPAQLRSMAYAKTPDGNLMEVVVYPGLNETQYQAIIQYARTERWPMTSEGLYHMLRRQKGQYGQTLVDAFLLTPEFLAIEMLFNRSEKNVEKKELLAMLCQGDWKLLSFFVEQQRLVQDLSPARRQKFLNDYIERESRAAAYLMLKTDGAFALKRLDDEHVIAMLKLLAVKTPEAEQFTLALLDTPRSDEVLEAASKKLFEFAGLPVPENNLTQTAIARFLSKSEEPRNELKLDKMVVRKEDRLVSKSKEVMLDKPKADPSSLSKPQSKPQIKMISAPKMASPKKIPQGKLVASSVPQPQNSRARMYVVGEGDSLWKIARRFNVDVEVIKKTNHLASDSLKPGTHLVIP